MIGKSHGDLARQEGQNDAAAPAGLWQRLELRLQRDGGEKESSEGGLWPRLEERAVAVPPQPRLRQGLEVKPVPQGEGRTYLLNDPRSGRRFRLGEREAFILSLLDGDHEVPEVVDCCRARFGAVEGRAVEQFLRELQWAGLLEEGSKLWGYLGLVRRDRAVLLWALSDAGPKLAALYRRLRWLFQPWVGGLLGLFLVGALGLLITRGDLLRSDLAYLVHPGQLWPFLLLTLYPAMALVVATHELAHALTCIHFGGEVPRLGFMLRHLLPAAFADVSAVWSMPRRARIGVFLAGPASTALWAAGATLLWAWTAPGSLVHLVGLAVLVASLLSLWVGINPVSGYDGTEVVSEWLRLPHLHRRALRYCWAALRRRPLPRVSPRERRIFCIYAISALLYNVAVVALIVALLLKVW